MAEYLKALAHTDPNMGDRVQQEHPQNWVEWGWGQEHENLQYLRTVQGRDKVTKMN